jgi:hypothetical protein
MSASYMKVLIMRFASPCIISSLLYPSVLLSTLFSVTLSLFSSVYVRYQVWPICKAASKIAVLCILTFTFSIRREDKWFWSNCIFIYHNIWGFEMDVKLLAAQRLPFVEFNLLFQVTILQEAALSSCFLSLFYFIFWIKLWMLSISPDREHIRLP